MTQPISVSLAFAGMVASLALAGWANKALSNPDSATPKIEISFALGNAGPTVLAGGVARPLARTV